MFWHEHKMLLALCRKLFIGVCLLLHPTFLTPFSPTKMPLITWEPHFSPLSFYVCVLWTFSTNILLEMAQTEPHHVVCRAHTPSFSPYNGWCSISRGKEVQMMFYWFLSVVCTHVWLSSITSVSNLLAFLAFLQKTSQKKKDYTCKTEVSPCSFDRLGSRALVKSGNGWKLKHGLFF